MIDNVECPFCGISFAPFLEHPAMASHPRVNGCDLSRTVQSIKQWNMRPPKKEQSSEKTGDLLMFHLAGEVQWLRSIVEKLAIEEQPTHYNIGLDYNPKDQEEAGK